MKCKNKILLFFCATLCFNTLVAQDDTQKYLLDIQKKFNSDLKLLTNPFGISYLEKIKNIKIQTIISDSVKIDHTWYKQGDFINEIAIKKITNKQLIFLYDNKEIIVDVKNVKMDIR